jgi:hypothetical protein
MKTILSYGYTMKIFLGQTGTKATVKKIQEQKWGRMWSRDRPNLYDGEPWAWDNGAYSWWVQGLEFHDVTFLKRLWRDYLVGVPYLAACPDMPACGMESLEFSLWWLARLPKAWPWYLVVQDGMNVDGVADELELFKGIFLGGTNEFKKTAHVWCDLAHRMNKKFHYGRCGTIDKVYHAKRIGADSIDSSTPVQNPHKMDAFIDAVNGTTEQLAMSI